MPPDKLPPLPRLHPSRRGVLLSASLWFGVLLGSRTFLKSLFFLNKEPGGGGGGGGAGGGGTSRTLSMGAEPLLSLQSGTRKDPLLVLCSM